MLVAVAFTLTVTGLLEVVELVDEVDNPEITKNTIKNIMVPNTE